MIASEKKKLYYSKFQRIVHSDFHLFIYLPVSKASLDSKHCQNLFTLDLRRFTLPSAFKIVKVQKVQAPQISMAYSPAKTFENLKSISDLYAYSIKHQAKWYAFGILDNLKPYKKPLSLCSITRGSFFKKAATFTKWKPNRVLVGFNQGNRAFSFKVLIKQKQNAKLYIKCLPLMCSNPSNVLRFYKALTFVFFIAYYITTGELISFCANEANPLLHDGHFPGVLEELEVPEALDEDDTSQQGELPLEPAPLPQEEEDELEEGEIREERKIPENLTPQDGGSDVVVPGNSTNSSGTDANGDSDMSDASSSDEKEVDENQPPRPKPDNNLSVVHPSDEEEKEDTNVL